MTTTVLLIFVSGLPPAEKPTQKKYFLMQHGPKSESNTKYDDYKRFMSRTSILFPIPPKIYAPLPTWLKRTLLLDFPMFQFDGEGKEGREAIEEEKKKAEDEA